MPTVEVNIEISFDKDSEPGSHGISVDAERLVDKCEYTMSSDPCSVLGAAADALEEAAKVCRDRADQLAWT